MILKDQSNSFELGCFQNGDTLMVKNGILPGQYHPDDISNQYPGHDPEPCPDGSIFTWVANADASITPGNVVEGAWVLQGQFVSTPGPVGTTGATGIQGNQGLTGPKGDQGIQGIQGIQGLTGPKGDKPQHTLVEGTDASGARTALLSFENPDGSPGTAVDVIGPKGDTGDITGLQGGDGISIDSSTGTTVNLDESTGTEVGGFTEPANDGTTYARKGTGDNTHGLWYPVPSTGGDGIKVTGDVIEIDFGSGLTIDGSGKLVPNIDNETIFLDGGVLKAKGGTNVPINDNPDKDQATITSFQPQSVQWGETHEDYDNNNAGNHNVWTDSAQDGGSGWREADQRTLRLPKGSNGALIAMTWRFAVGPNDRQKYGTGASVRAGGVQAQVKYRVDDAPSFGMKQENGNFGGGNESTLFVGNGYAHSASGEKGDFTRFKTENYVTKEDMWRFGSREGLGSDTQIKIRISFEARRRKTSRMRGNLGSRMIITPFYNPSIF